MRIWAQRDHRCSVRLAQCACAATAEINMFVNLFMTCARYSSTASSGATRGLPECASSSSVGLSQRPTSIASQPAEHFKTPHKSEVGPDFFIYLLLNLFRRLFAARSFRLAYDVRRTGCTVLIGIVVMLGCLRSCSALCTVRAVHCLKSSDPNFKVPVLCSAVRVGPDCDPPCAHQSLSPVAR